jgi:hypothetical protein
MRRRRIVFNDIQFEPDAVSSHLQEISRTLTSILGNILNEMVDLDRFDLDGVVLRLNRLETKGKMLLFSGYAQIERFPKSG